MAAQHFLNTPPKASGAANNADTVATETIITGQNDRITGSVFCDRAGTLYIEQSGDNQNWDISTSYPITAGDGSGFSEEIILAYARVRFKNTSASDATVLRLFVRTTSAGAR